ncbi:RNase A-like domain-containing protein [Streptomyces kanasensis]|uniref:RNase A-like domain-containing protein n=1 Tax=Streptomyces kanasensis TaxID=936756 RepID=UPI0037002818
MTLGMGQDSAVAAQSARLAGAENKLSAAESALDDSRLADIVRRSAAISGCDKVPLLEKPTCYREFATKAIKVGAGIGVFAYGIHYLHKDTVEHFGTVKKEVAGLQKLREAFKEDPTTIADPAYRKQVEERIQAAAAGARADIDKLMLDVLRTIETIMVMIQMTLLLLQLVLVLAQIVGNPQYKAAADAVKDGLRGVNKVLDDINAGFAQMNRALDDMNRAIDDVNRSMDHINTSLNQANKAMDQINAGIGVANKAMDDMNKAVPGIAKGAEKLRELPAIDFDFSNLGKTWSDGSSGLDNEEQQRRMSVLLGLLPGIGDGKGIVEAITGKDLMTGEHVEGFDRGLGSLAVLRWLKLGGKLLPDDIRNARKGDTAFECNSFPAGTPVLMANGSRKPIEDVQPGDEVLATDPGGDTELTLPRPVQSASFTSSYTDQRFVRLEVAEEGGHSEQRASLTSTEHHRYWLPQRQAWVPADEVRQGDQLRTDEGALAAVTGTSGFMGSQDTYDLDVSGIDSYYVQVGTQDVLVHNCTDLARAERMFPGVAHTLDEHVNVTQQQMQELAIRKTRKLGKPTPNSRWVDQQTAQQVVDYAVAGNGARIQKWLREGARTPLELKGTFGAKNSLGDVMTHDGKFSKAGNGYVVLLQRAPGHKPGGYYVSTAYPV